MEVRRRSFYMILECYHKRTLHFDFCNRAPRSRCSALLGRLEATHGSARTGVISVSVQQFPYTTKIERDRHGEQSEKERDMKGHGSTQMEQMLNFLFIESPLTSSPIANRYEPMLPCRGQSMINTQVWR